MAVHCHSGQVHPVATLHEIRDMLTLALDASERRSYTRTEREARSYMRSALRRVDRLTEVQA
ncbi:hypothetical protein [Paenirhodobacter enshiensis]|uniref:hypothetical protein n=1 Tax=Paenirhodobacter enshiensis TaxID=1105367 RepID=UPI0035B4965E